MYLRVECLPSMHKVLGSFLSMEKKKKKEIPII